jgi:catechol 2,3-dioxygenase-like lactoylglutathione lyase family enzyme
MIDHVGFAVSDYAHSKRFYVDALAPLGYGLLMEFENVGGFGAGGKPDFWISQGTPVAPLHIAILARDRATVDAFHAAALRAGGRDNGAPGLRPQYHPNYYGAYVRDPDGNKIQAVCHRKDG